MSWTMVVKLVAIIIINIDLDECVNNNIYVYVFYMPIGYSMLGILIC